MITFMLVVIATMLVLVIFQLAVLHRKSDMMELRINAIDRRIK